VKTLEHIAPASGASLQNILEQFDKLEDENQRPQTKKVRVRKTSDKRFSVPHFEINTQPQSPKHFLLNVRKGLLSPTKRNSEKISLNNVPTIQETELIEANHLGAQSLSPRRPTIGLLQGEVLERRGSTLVLPRVAESHRDLDSQARGLTGLIIPRRVAEQQTEKPKEITDTRRFSSPMLIGGPQFRAGLPNPLKISRELKLNVVPNSFRDSPVGSKNLDISPGLSPSKSTRSGTLSSQAFESKPNNSGPRSSWTIDSSNLLPISNDYLLKVILNKTGGSNPNSHTGSPNTPGTPENSNHQGYQFGKRGSFSVFRKVVETEAVKNG